MIQGNFRIHIEANKKNEPELAIRSLLRHGKFISILEL